MNDNELQALASELGMLLIDQNLTIATAESCTGGWVSKIVTDVMGSSQWFECAMVTYSNRAKHQLLGVDENILKDFGAVSQQTVKAMVLGLLDRCDANMGVSISGIAGPGGGTPEKPVGTVWMAWAKPGQVIETMKFSFDGDRDGIRRQAVYEALQGLKRLLDNG